MLLNGSLYKSSILYYFLIIKFTYVHLEKVFSFPLLLLTNVILFCEYHLMQN